MDFNQVFEQQVEHLTKLALTKGWRPYAKHRAEQLEDESPDMFKGLIDAIRERLKEHE